MHGYFGKSIVFAGLLGCFPLGGAGLAAAYDNANHKYETYHRRSGADEASNQEAAEDPSLCGNNRVFARYANLIVELIEQNFYVNDTYTCAYAYYTPPPPNLMAGGSTKFFYKCIPTLQEFGNNSSPAKETEGGAAASPTYFEAVVSTAAYAQPTMTVQITPYTYGTPYSTTYTGNEIPQPAMLTNTATLDPTIQEE